MVRPESFGITHWRRHGSRHPSEESIASGLYGIIVSSAVMAASHTDYAGVLTAAVLVTLVIYWSAERYARLVAERIQEGRRPTWAHVRAQLSSGWEFVTASLLPLATLLLVRLTGAELTTSVFAALACSTLLLCLAGWGIGAQGNLSVPERLGVAGVAGLFGVALILLKALLH